MATVNFLYRSTKNSGDLTLRLLFRKFGDDIIIGANSRITIEKVFWKKQLNQKNLKDINHINDQTKYKKIINDLSVHILNQLKKTDLNIVNKEWLQHHIDIFYNPEELQPKVPVFLTDYFDYYIELLITNRNTKKKLVTTRNKLTIYEKKTKIKLAIEELNNFKLHTFKQYLTDLKYNQNTIIGDLTNIKTICRHAKTALNVNEEIFNWSLKK
ncbi:phage integrase SAM-like domain-containing protein [Flavobacterium sp. N3904]|uniref:phage integrase SAM-like domain-containing protein n=1 Tax=Flavobacterium sp. N3904 TaxID=2986835 RepID=UPI0022258BF8|nr:phage integrase SAM-like domain-containing protein [Flavobacterium sp. N3904]